MLFIVGKISRDFREYLALHDIAYGLFAAAESKVSGTPHVYPLNFTDKQNLLESLQSLQPAPDVSAVITTGFEQYVLADSYIAEYFHVPGLSPEAALAATDKIIMRERFKAHSPAITPDFAAVQTWDDAAAFMRHHSFPVMLKPANLMKSLYISKNGSLNELRHNYALMQTALPAIYDQYGLNGPRIIIEECMTGTMHTVAGFVDASGETTLLDDVVDCITAGELGKPDNYLFARQLPTTLSPESAIDIKKVALQGVAALKLRSSPIHAEIILTPEGPKIIEIGARMGGYRPRMYGVATGIDMYQAAIDIANGQTLHVKASRHRACTVLELFADTEGRFAEVMNQAALHKLASFTYSKLSVQPGLLTGRAQAGFRAPLIVMLDHPQQTQVAADVAWIRNNVQIKLQA